MLMNLHRFNLPRGARPNLVARLLMMIWVQSTCMVAWGVPGSIGAWVIKSGGLPAQMVFWVLGLAMVVGVVDVIANDIVGINDPRPYPGLYGWIAAQLEASRVPWCFIVGAAYMVQAFAAWDAPKDGVFIIIIVYLELAFCIGLGGWSLLILRAAVPDATFRESD